MNLEKELSERFNKAVRDLIKPPVLVSPRWIRPGPGKDEFEFIGTLKIAKATGRKAQRIASQLSKIVKVDDLKLDMKITGAGVILLSRQRKAASKAKKTQ
ncbi:MAG: hypothetical protein ACYS5V_03380 [Planctomycetota bacterium]|jgi:hypothetical protein